jgi:hypothetical protein
VELLLTALFLYGVQCLARLSAGAVLFVRAGGRIVVAEGPGWRLLHPLPSGGCWVAARTSLREDGGRARERFESESVRVSRATNALAGASNAYLALLFAVLPVLIGWLGPEPALYRFLPVIGVAHLVTICLALRAHRRLLPGSSADLAERLLVAALYPPAALRFLQELRRAVLGGFHPAVVALAVLPEAERPVFLRAEWVRLERSADEQPGPCGEPGVAEQERAALVGLAAAAGISQQTLLAPRPREDPAAASYCPLCLCDYRAGPDGCSDCRVALVGYAE